MSTPIKPPGGPSSGPGSIESSATDATSAPGAFKEAVASERAAESKDIAATEGTATTEASAPVQALVDDVRAGRLDVDGAIDQLLDRALSTASGLPPTHRQALEAQLRGALGEDPTLLALRRELERASTT